MTPEELEQGAANWCQPISEGSFCGEPSRYEDAYELLLTETAKLESVHGEECNWKAVRDAADELTREKTKDMTVLGALAVAELQLAGTKTLPMVIWAYRWLIENQSKEMFPNAARRRGRASAYGWMVKLFETYFESYDPPANSFGELWAFTDQFEQLDDLMRIQLEEDHPGSKPLRATLAAKVESIRPPEVVDTPDEALQPTATDPGASDPRASAAGADGQVELAVPGSITSSHQADGTLKAALGALKKVAEYFAGDPQQSVLGHHLRHTVSLLEDASFGERPEPLKELIKEARQVAQRDGLAQGCAILQDALKGAGTAELRFRLRLALADICAEGAAADLAQPILADLHEEIKTPVGEWLPGLQIELATVTLSCNKQLADGGKLNPKQTAELEKQSEEMMTLLSRLAPSIALESR